MVGKTKVNNSRVLQRQQYCGTNFLETLHIPIILPDLPPKENPVIPLIFRCRVLSLRHQFYITDLNCSSKLQWTVLCVIIWQQTWGDNSLVMYLLGHNGLSMVMGGIYCPKKLIYSLSMANQWICVVLISNRGGSQSTIVRVLVVCLGRIPNDSIICHAFAFWNWTFSQERPNGISEIRRSVLNTEMVST